MNSSDQSSQPLSAEERAAIFQSGLQNLAPALGVNLSSVGATPQEDRYDYAGYLNNLKYQSPSYIRPKTANDAMQQTQTIMPRLTMGTNTAPATIAAPQMTAVRLARTSPVKNSPSAMWLQNNKSGGQDDLKAQQTTRDLRAAEAVKMAAQTPQIGAVVPINALGASRTWNGYEWVINPGWGS